MDSLLANYASSDEEEELEQQEVKQPKEADYPSKFGGSSSSSSFFSSLPAPNSSSLFHSLTPPKFHPNPPQTLRNPSSSDPNNQEEDDDDEDEEEPQQQQQLEDSRLPSKFSEQSSSAAKYRGPTIPSSVFSSLPQPKSSSLFSSLPQPNTQNSDPQTLTSLSSSSDLNPKRVVQFRPPINPSLMKSRDVDDVDEDDDVKEKQRKKSNELASLTQTPSVKSFLSNIPAPKNSVALGALPSSSGSGRRSILEADIPASNLNGAKTESEASVYPNVGNYEGQSVDGPSLTSLGAVGGSSEYAVGGGGDPSNWVPASEIYVNYDGYGGYGNGGGGGGDPSKWISASENYVTCDSYGGYGNYGNYESKWVDRSTAPVAPDLSEAAESVVRMPGKRGRNDVPQEIVEIKQDELIKNRPREDQVKLTGIAFGPSYQPVSTKGKPSKLQKRKHQIGSLYFDMKQKEMELAERRSRGFLTKSETQAKYGW